MLNKQPMVSFITPVSDIGNACWYYRCELPRRMLLSRGWDASMNRPYACDIAVFARAKDTQALRLMESLGRKGVFLVYDLDDDIWSVDPENPFSKDITPEVIRGAEQAMQAADLITVTTTELADVIQERTGKKAEILPNCVDPRDFTDTLFSHGGQKFSELFGFDHRRPVIFVSGSVSHYKDFQDLRAIAAAHPLGDDALWVGLVPKELWSLFPKGSLLEAPVDYPVYMSTLKFLGTLPNVLGFVPLANTKFNCSKSRLKWAEYALAGIPGVYSGVNEYRSVASVFAPANATIQDWVRALQDGWENRARIREEDGLMARSVADMNKWVTLWEDTFKKLITTTAV